MCQDIFSCLLPKVKISANSLFNQMTKLLKSIAPLTSDERGRRKNAPKIKINLANIDEKKREKSSLFLTIKFDR